MVINASATLTRFCRPVEAVARVWPLLHANSFGEPLVRAGCQVGTKADELLQGAPRVPPSEVLPLPDTPDTPEHCVDSALLPHYIIFNIKINTRNITTMN